MCGIIGIASHDPVLESMATGMLAQQHRGKESAGIAFFTAMNEMIVFRRMGFVNELFQEYNILTKHNFGTNAAIGHIRYATTGDSSLKNAHPIFGKCQFGKIAIVHNGNITNAVLLKERCRASNPIVCQTETDTEIILHLIAQSTKTTLDEALIDTAQQLEGAFSFILLSKDAIYAVRDPHEFRGLALGRTESSYVFASETVALDVIGAKFIREVAAGEIIKIDLNHLTLDTITPTHAANTTRAHCAFEAVYLKSPASMHTDSNNEEVYGIRQRFGFELGKYFIEKYYTEHSIFASLPNMVIPIPDSGNPAALGFSRASGIPFDPCIVRDHYSSRTFLSPQQKHRESGVRTKFHPTTCLLKDKRVVIVDDSLVRGTTLKWVVSKLFKGQCAVKEVHVCIASPPLLYPCFYGVDMKSYNELIAAQKTEKEICDFIGANSLTYIPIELFKKILGKNTYCFACFNGDYPV